MNRRTYDVDEVRQQARVLGEQSKLASTMHAMNYRQRFTDLLALFRRDEPLALLADVLNAHPGPDTDAKSYYAKACQGPAPALPGDRYTRMALVFHVISAVMLRESKVDFHYLCTCGFPGPSLGHKVEAFRTGVLEPFLEDLRGLFADVAKTLPATGTVDLYEAYVAHLGAS